ncbi:unnamed protein product [Ixodes pacificus]
MRVLSIYFFSSGPTKEKLTVQQTQMFCKMHLFYWEFVINGLHSTCSAGSRRVFGSTDLSNFFVSCHRGNCSSPLASFEIRISASFNITFKENGL